MRSGIWDFDTSTRLAYREIKANEFASSNVYQIFAIKCNLDEDKNNVAIHTDFMVGHPSVDLYVDY